MTEDDVRNLMGLVIGVACAGIEYGETDSSVLARERLTALHAAEDAVEAELRKFLDKSEGPA